MNGLIILIAFVCVCLLTKGIFSPAKLYGAMWAILTIGYFCFSGKAIPGLGLLWIAASMIILAAGERIGVGHASKAYKNNQNSVEAAITPASGRVLFRALLLVILIALTGKMLFLYANGYNVSVFFNVNKFLNMNTQMAYDRYNGLTVTNNAITLLSSFGYVAPLCGGYLLPYTGKSKKRILLCIFSLFPVLLSMAMDNTKSGVIDAAILFAIGFMVSYMKVYKRFPKLKTRHIIAIIGLLALLMLALFVAMCIRIGDFSQSTISDVKESAIVYAFGCVEAFDVWLSKYFTFGSYGFGVNTFMAPFDLLGIVSRVQGLYDFIPGVESNVFTSFRGLILDFGVFGGLLFMFAVGVVSGITYKKIRSCGSAASQIIYASIMFFLVRSYLCSPWVYTSFWVVFFVFLLFILLASTTWKKSVVKEQVKIA